MLHDKTDFMDANMLRMVGPSGPLSLGTQYAGRYFDWP
jgi:hypothetical protein